MSPAPTFYAARPIAEGRVSDDETWIGLCGVESCGYWSRGDDLQSVVDHAYDHVTEVHDG